MAGGVVMRWLALLCLLVAGQAWATSWYIDPVGGASGNAGTSEGAPKSALSQATVAAGDEVYFKRGTTHSGQITCVSGNSTSDPTLYGAYGTGANPILTTNNNVFLCQDKRYVRIEGVTIKPTLSTAAAVRADRPRDFVFSEVDFDGSGGGLDGLRMEAVSTGGSQYMDNISVSDSAFHDFTQGDGIRMFIGATDAAVVSTGVSVTNNTFDNIGKAPARFSYQNASYGVRDHYYKSFTFTHNTITNSLNSTPTTVDDDQCLHFRNIRETNLGNSVIGWNTVRNCGRNSAQTTGADTALITGYWFEGMTNVIVRDNIGEDIRTPNNDGGVFFLDANTAAADQYITTGNLFLRNRASGASGNTGCTPFTATQCNNSEGFSVTRGASNNTFIGNIARGNPIGFHVTGNAGVNYWYHNSAGSNNYGFYLQTNSGDTPAGVAQVMKNNVACGNTDYDYRHGSSPKADETYNDFCTMDGDTQDATTLAVDPLWAGGSTPDSDEGFCLKSTSPLLAAGTYIGAYATGYNGEDLGKPPAIGARGLCRSRQPAGVRPSASRTVH